MPKPRVIPAVILGWIVCAQAFAQSVGASCSVSNSSVAFASYNPISATALQSSASLIVTCSTTAGLTIPFTILLSAGNSGNVQNRTMTSGNATLPYNLYIDASYSTVWNNSTGVSSKVDSVGTQGIFHGSSTLTVYGRIPAMQAVPSGIYTDALTITVDY